MFFLVENSTIFFLKPSLTPTDLIIKYHTEGSACRIENVRLDRLKTGLNMDKIEDDIEEDREGRLKD